MISSMNYTIIDMIIIVSFETMEFEINWFGSIGMAASESGQGESCQTSAANAERKWIPGHGVVFPARVLGSRRR